jgi:hypothetical protein
VKLAKSYYFYIQIEYDQTLYLTAAVSFAVLPGLLPARTWKPLGVDENNNPTLGFTSYNTIAISPDGTPYIALRILPRTTPLP